MPSNLTILVYITGGDNKGHRLFSISLADALISGTENLIFDRCFKGFPGMNVRALFY